MNYLTDCVGNFQKEVKGLLMVFLICNFMFFKYLTIPFPVCDLRLKNSVFVFFRSKSVTIAAI